MNSVMNNDGDRIGEWINAFDSYEITRNVPSHVIGNHDNDDQTVGGNYLAVYETTEKKYEMKQINRPISGSMVETWTVIGGGNLIDEFHND